MIEKKEKIKVYELDVNEANQMMAVALVDAPAIEVNWFAFNKETEHQFKVTNADRRIVTGAILVPTKNIPRVAMDGTPYFVRFTPSAVERAVQQFMANSRTTAVNLMHRSTDVPEGVYIFEIFIQDSQRGIQHPEGFSELPEGTAYASMKIENDEVWAAVKDGKFKGFSIEGNFIDSEVEEVTEKEAKEMLTILAELLTKL